MLTNFQLKQLKLNLKLDIVEKPENRVHKLTDSNGALCPIATNMLHSKRRAPRLQDKIFKIFKLVQLHILFDFVLGPRSLVHTKGFLARLHPGATPRRGGPVEIYTHHLDRRHVSARSFVDLAPTRASALGLCSMFSLAHTHAGRS